MDVKESPFWSTNPIASSCCAKFDAAPATANPNAWPRNPPKISDNAPECYINLQLDVLPVKYWISLSFWKKSWLQSNQATLTLILL